MPTDTTLAARARTLLASRAESVNAAASRLRIPQKTLQRIVIGETANPHGNTLAKLAAGYGVTIDWLLHGVGGTPAGRLDRYVRALRLEKRDERALQSLLMAPVAAAEVMVLGRPLADAFLPAGPEPARFGDRLAEAWLELFLALEHARGRAAVRRIVREYKLFLALGGSDIGSLLMADAAVRTKIERFLDPKVRALHVPPHPMMVPIGTTEPATDDARELLAALRASRRRKK